MSQPPEHDPHVPQVQISAGGAVAQWLREAARRLGITVATEASIVIVPRPEPVLDGHFEAVHAVRSAHGQVVTYPVAGELFDHGDLRSVRVPDPAVSPERSAHLQELAIGFVTELGVIGAACLRFEPGSLSVASAARGIDATSAWTHDAAVTPLVENHLRAQFDLPLGAPMLLGRASATCTFREAPGMFAALRHCMARDPRARIHFYGTAAASGTTIGHVSVVSDDADDSLRRARHAADYLTGTIEE